MAIADVARVVAARYGVVAEAAKAGGAAASELAALETTLTKLGVDLDSFKASSETQREVLVAQRLGSDAAALGFLQLVSGAGQSTLGWDVLPPAVGGTTPEPGTFPEQLDQLGI